MLCTEFNTSDAFVFVVFVPFSLHDFLKSARYSLNCLYTGAYNLIPGSFIVFLEDMEDLCAGIGAVISNSKSVKESDKLPLFCESFSPFFSCKIFSIL